MKEIRYPAWHDDARAMFKNGATFAQIADKYMITASRARQIAGPNWKAYLVFQAPQRRSPGKTMADYSRDVSQYTMVPDDTKLSRSEGGKSRGGKVPQNFKQHVENQFMPAPRDFETVKKMVEGKVLVGGKITCCKCGATAEYFNNRGSITPAYLPKEFARMGWSVGKNARYDTCPSCVKISKIDKVYELEAAVATSSPVPAKEVKEVKEPIVQVEDKPVIPPSTPVVPVTPAPVAPVAAPVVQPVAPVNGVQSLIKKDIQEMSKMDHRIIFSKLNEVYGDEKTGYQGEWDDNKVADDLGVPKEWVSQIRDEHFGPETNAIMMRQQIDSIVKAGQAIERRVVLLDKKLETMQQLDQKITDLVNAGGDLCEKMEDVMERFNQLVANLKTQDDQQKAIIEGFNSEVATFKKMFAELQR